MYQNSPSAVEIVHRLERKNCVPVSANATTTSLELISDSRRSQTPGLGNAQTDQK
jgi:hypothetical protein